MGWSESPLERAYDALMNVFAALPPIMTAFSIVGGLLGVVFFGWIVVQLFGHRLPRGRKYNPHAEDRAKRPIGMGW